MELRSGAVTQCNRLFELFSRSCDDEAEVFKDETEDLLGAKILNVPIKIKRGILLGTILLMPRSHDIRDVRYIEGRKEKRGAKQNNSAMELKRHKSCS